MNRLVGWALPTNVPELDFLCCLVGGAHYKFSSWEIVVMVNGLLRSALVGLCLMLLAGCSVGEDKPASTATPQANGNVSTVVETPQAPSPAATPESPIPAPPTPSSQLPTPNSQLFVDWPKPDVAIVITGEQMGYIEPCGCAGLENQKGGLARRHTLVKQLAEKGWPVLPVDVGGTILRFGQQQELKFQTAVESLREIGYVAVGWGPEDLRLPAGVLASCVAETDGSPSRFVSANVGLFALDSGLTSRYRVVERGGKKFGITAILADDLQKEVNNEDIKFTSAEAALAEVAPTLQAESDFRILLSYAEPAETKRLVQKVNAFQVVVTAHGAAEPPAEATRIDGSNAQLIEVGHKGMFAIVLGLYNDATTPVRYQRVPIDARFVDSPEMLRLKEAYQAQLKTLGWDGLGLAPRRYPGASGLDDAQARFVGSQACADCHPTAFGIWKETPHAHATDTLARLAPPRQFDPECISCHALGWNPQEFYPYASGFVGLDSTPHLAGNGCENCHGPGSGHLLAEQGTDRGLQDLGRQRMKISLETAKKKTCAACHDLDNSPKFEFDKYWPEVEHHGKK